jgi:hypothetical protein
MEDYFNANPTEENTMNKIEMINGDLELVIEYDRRMKGQDYLKEYKNELFEEKQWDEDDLPTKRRLMCKLWQ